MHDATPPAAVDRLTNSSPGPLADRGRIGSIDVLRGVAVLGILVMNIQSFSMVGAAYLNPLALGELTGADYWTWLVGYLFFNEKFIAIFSMLFGAGIVLMAERREQAGSPVAGLHYRRMAFLLLFGLLHAHLLWYGDILVPYALCGLGVFLFRKVRPGRLVVLAVLVFAVPTLISLGAQASLPHWPEGQLETMRDTWWQPSEELLAAEEATYRSGWLEQLPKRSATARFMETQLFLMETAWRCAGLMLLGMALMKWGVFGAALPRRRYLAMLAVGLFAGLPVVVYGVIFNASRGWSIEHSFFLGGELNYWGSPLVACGWIGLVMLVCQAKLVPRLTARLAAVGRMAFTSYLLQTILCTLLFYGHGFGLFGKVSRAEQLLVVASVWVLLLVLAPWWLSRFRFGPVEWLWRTLSYGRLTPMRR